MVQVLSCFGAQLYEAWKAFFFGLPSLRLMGGGVNGNQASGGAKATNNLDRLLSSTNIASSSSGQALPSPWAPRGAGGGSREGGTQTGATSSQGGGGGGGGRGGRGGGGEGLPASSCALFVSLPMSAYLAPSSDTLTTPSDAHASQV